MGKRKTTDEFIKEANIIHKGKYDYSLVEYKNNRTKVKIICREHGVFEQVPSSHLNGKNCLKCKGTAKKTTEQFIKEAKQVHKDKYDYSLVNYINNKTPVEIICKEHGEFRQRAREHVKGVGCKKCYYQRRKVTIDNFIERCSEKYNFKYDYSLVKFNKINDKVKIICPIHGIFEQRASNHISNKYGCVECSNNESRSSLTYFIEKSNKIHNNYYNYGKSVYVTDRTKVIIICPIHGDFKQMPYKHLQNRGCPKCKFSKGELEISKWLDNNNIKYEHQKTFKDLTYRSNLKCDFYLPNYNLVIEYNGIQHYEPVDHFGGMEALNETKRRDNIKEEYMRENNINFLIIKYTNFNKIDEILTKNLIS